VGYLDGKSNEWLEFFMKASNKSLLRLEKASNLLHGS
jgi:hypothetical protein